MCGILRDVNRPGFPWSRSGCHASAAAATPKRGWARMRTGVREDSWDQPCKKCPVLLNFRMERFDIMEGFFKKVIVSKSGFKQITKTRWILQHFDGISLAKQNADRGTSFLTSMCFQRKNDGIFLRKFQSNLRFGSQAKPGVVKRKLRVLPNERWQIKGLSMPFVSEGGACPPKQMRLHNGYTSVLLGVLCVG